MIFDVINLFFKINEQYFKNFIFYYFFQKMNKIILLYSSMQLHHYVKYSIYNEINLIFF